MAYQFAVSLGTITNFFHEWLEIISMRLKYLIMWSSREIVSENMPQVFKDLYPRARCIIHYSEAFTERPTSFQARAKTYSKNMTQWNFLQLQLLLEQYHFISVLWGSSVWLTLIFLHRIEPGDLVLADRGFIYCRGFSLLWSKVGNPSIYQRKKAAVTRSRIFAKACKS